MRKAALIISIIELCILPLIYLATYNVCIALLETIPSSEEVPLEFIEFLRNLFIVDTIVSLILGIIFLIVVQILIAKKRKIAAGILTIIFVSKIAGVLTFFIKYDDNKAIDNNESNSSEDTL